MTTTVSVLREIAALRHFFGQTRMSASAFRVVMAGASAGTALGVAWSMFRCDHRLVSAQSGTQAPTSSAQAAAGSKQRWVVCSDGLEAGHTLKLVNSE